MVFSLVGCLEEGFGFDDCSDIGGVEGDIVLGVVLLLEVAVSELGIAVRFERDDIGIIFLEEVSIILSVGGDARDEVSVDVFGVEIGGGIGNTVSHSKDSITRNNRSYEKIFFVVGNENEPC